MAARVVSIYDGVNEAGRNNVITLGFGQRDGAEVGHVLALYRERGSVDYRDAEAKQTYKLPEKRSGWCSCSGPSIVSLRARARQRRPRYHR